MESKRKPTRTLWIACENRQIKFGIVSSDGVIIDGNRRASLMNKILKDPHSIQEEKDRCKFFKAVILPESAT